MQFPPIWIPLLNLFAKMNKHITHSDTIPSCRFASPNSWITAYWFLLRLTDWNPFIILVLPVNLCWQGSPRSERSEGVCGGMLFHNCPCPFAKKTRISRRWVLACLLPLTHWFSTCKHVLFLKIIFIQITRMRSIKSCEPPDALQARRNGFTTSWELGHRDNPVRGLKIKRDAVSKGATHVRMILTGFIGVPFRIHDWDVLI